MKGSFETKGACSIQKDYALSEVQALIRAHLEGEEQASALETHASLVRCAERAERLASPVERVKDDARRLRDFWALWRSRWRAGPAGAFGLLLISLPFLALAFLRPERDGVTALGLGFGGLTVFVATRILAWPWQERKRIRTEMSRERLARALRHITSVDPRLCENLLCQFALHCH